MYMSIATSRLFVYFCEFFHNTVMFVDVGENRAVLDNLSYSFVSSTFALIRGACNLSNNWWR